ncbi:MAG: Oligopeptide ABC transporter, periplasmic oligopeptide-binding protein OppA [uncultured Thermomicrobiales bacterium]|uniref:Oligopeptide ABC transporter, periplasmic oligopeptide-binding protein OppA n=1 Tax=uncultured Thermomicrobiales bacterium TaxID=1645740 RepID=A0A6J4UJ35_9BACT|nr:MAG: Oligopeptide ABC transporter, periplasmic oligopeptide-binding protein OppA [uncultured Thermomicrobiales bacterium]
MPADGTALRQLGQAWAARGLARRDLLRLAGAGVSLAALGGLLAACGGDPPAPPVPPVASAAPASTPGALPTVGVRASTVSGLPPSAASSYTPVVATRTVGPSATPAASTGDSGYPAGGRYSTIEPVGKRGGGVVEVYFADATTNNPLLTTDTASNARIALQYPSLLGLDPDTALPFPELASVVPTRENGGVSPDGLTYTFALRRDVHWSDGTPFTAGDVVFTYQTLARKELGSPRTAQINDRIAGVSSPDDHTVVFALRRIVAPFLVTNCAGAGYGIVPRHILGGVPIEQIKGHPFSVGDPQVSVATGPFTFGEWVRGEGATLVKNPRYFRGEPALDRYRFRVVKDSPAVAVALQTGEADWGLVPLNLYDEMARRAQLTTTKYDGYSFEYAAFQLDPAKATLFLDKGVRRALAHALDREALARSLYSGLATVARGTLPTLSFAYAPERVTPQYAYDTKRAEALLEEAGWKRGADGIRVRDGQRLQFTIWTNAGNTIREALVASMQGQWRAIGVEATPRAEEWGALLTRINETRDFEMFLIGFSWDADPDQSQMWSSRAFPPNGFNLGQYANAEVDALLDRGLAELDRDKRTAIYAELQGHILDDAPAIILVFPQVIAAVNKRLHNCFPNAVGAGPRWNAHLWWVEDGR